MKKIRKKLIDKGVKQLQNETLENQLAVLIESVKTGQVDKGTLKKQLQMTTTSQMKDSVREAYKNGKEPSVTELLLDYYKEPQFQELARLVGLEERWFVHLAETTIEQWGENHQ